MGFWKKLFGIGAAAGATVAAVKVADKVKKNNPDGIGDVNGDGRVNSMDYLLIKRYMLRSADLTKDEQANADVNGDGTVNAKDYIWVKRYVLRTE